MSAEAIKNQAMKYIARYNCTSGQLQKHLIKKFDAENYEVIEKIVQEIENKRYIDDNQYSYYKAQSLLIKGKSLRYISEYLRNKFIDNQTAEKAVDDLYNTVQENLDYIGGARFVIKNYHKLTIDNEPSFDLFCKKMLTKGFNYSTIQFVYNASKEELENIAKQLS